MAETVAPETGPAQRDQAKRALLEFSNKKGREPKRPSVERRELPRRSIADALEKLREIKRRKERRTR